MSRTARQTVRTQAQCPPPVDVPRRELTVALRLDSGKELRVGRLSYAGRKFRFRYSDEFRKSGLRTLPGFPDINRDYESEHLWPFFQVRLPPQSRADVAQVMRDKHLDAEDVIELLKVLGQRTITSPYVIHEEPPSALSGATA